MYKNAFTVLIVFIFCSSCQTHDSSKNYNQIDSTSSIIVKEREVVVTDSFFTGKWNYVMNNQSQNYTLDLYVKDSNLSGTYCFVGNNGNLIDCSDDVDTDQPNILGSIDSNTFFKGKLFSEYSGRYYDIEMMLQNDTLYLNIVNADANIFYSKNLKFIRALD